MQMKSLQNQLNHRCRRNNLRIYDIKEEPDEAWEACEENPKYHYRLTGNIEWKKIERCHKIGPCKTKAGQDQDQTRTVVCRLNRFKDRERILNNAKKPWKTLASLYMSIFQRTPWN